MFNRSEDAFRSISSCSITSSLFGTGKDGSDNPFQEVTLQNAIIDEEDEKKKAFEVSDKYMDFLNRSKTEREFVKSAKELANENGFKDLI